MIKTIAIIVLALAVIIIAIADYRLQLKYNELRAGSMDMKHDLVNMVCYIYHKGWEDRAWGSRLPSYERTERRAKDLYLEYFSNEEPSE